MGKDEISVYKEILGFEKEVMFFIKGYLVGDWFELVFIL